MSANETRIHREALDIEPGRNREISKPDRHVIAVVIAHSQPASIRGTLNVYRITSEDPVVVFHPYTRLLRTRQKPKI